jgi:hypothetical protein
MIPSEHREGGKRGFRVCAEIVVGSWLLIMIFEAGRWGFSLKAPRRHFASLWARPVRHHAICPAAHNGAIGRGAASCRWPSMTALSPFGEWLLRRVGCVGDASGDLDDIHIGEICLASTL